MKAGNLVKSQDEPCPSLEPTFFTQKETESGDWYRVILQPVRQFVKADQAVIVPDHDLALVPFAGLIDENGKYVAETLRVRLDPSLATAKMIAHYPCEDDASAIPLIVGDPEFPAWLEAPKRLPNAKIVAESELLGVEPLTAEKATKQAFLRRMRSANLIHIAAHGDAQSATILLTADPAIPESDLNEEDFLLTPSNLEPKRLKAKLVVLSYCHSGSGQVKGEGVISIARAFLGAGAHAVLMTVRVIDDLVTFFMEEFYGRLTSGVKTSEALQSTMNMMNGDACHDPSSGHRSV